MQVLEPIIIHVDNQGGMLMASNSFTNKRSKHVRDIA